MLGCRALIKHTLEISERPASVSLRNHQLLIRAGELERRYACEDVGVLILEHPGITISAAAVNELLTEGAVVLFCGANHLPTGMLLPTITHTELVPRMMNQLQADQPSRKRLWKEIVRSKIQAQAANVTEPYKRKLGHLASKVKSGDPENREAQAAKIYWPAYFPDQYGAGMARDYNCSSFFNSALNYGYAIMRAAVARALVSAGLLPALGVFHKRRDNPYCLADDVMEPLRPIVDTRVKELLQDTAHGDTQPNSLEKEHRAALLSLLSERVTCGDFEGPLMVALPRYISSFYRMLTKEAYTLLPPYQCSSHTTDVCG
ncbi:CRISPR-associated protein, Cas1 family [Rubritalea squalenifaciens DSM 18772]|uniref:CRISPR-associated endonuclease Cas1 n=1 Tax=Rubritalea squalenifaciens DSM 18772 TaxID=1123071 RepID=A0A1M6BQB4_9BACT|nr:CRISPR-associated protein, Cas1 family [Rubritalea squalenifaciens DSM 18772]